MQGKTLQNYVLCRHLPKVSWWIEVPERISLQYLQQMCIFASYEGLPASSRGRQVENKPLSSWIVMAQSHGFHAVPTHLTIFLILVSDVHLIELTSKRIGTIMCESLSLHWKSISLFPSVQLGLGLIHPNVSSWIYHLSHQVKSQLIDALCAGGHFNDWQTCQWIWSAVQHPWSTCSVATYVKMSHHAMIFINSQLQVWSTQLQPHLNDTTFRSTFMTYKAIIISSLPTTRNSGSRNLYWSITTYNSYGLMGWPQQQCRPWLVKS